MVESTRSRAAKKAAATRRRHEEEKEAAEEASEAAVTDTPQEDLVVAPVEFDTEEPEEAPEIVVKYGGSKRVVKYMGSADVKILSPNENIMHSLSPEQEPGQYVVWTADGRNYTIDNLGTVATHPGHVVFSEDYPNVPDAFWEALTSMPSREFQDVTEQWNGHEQDPHVKVPRGIYDLKWRHIHDHTGRI